MRPAYTQIRGLEPVKLLELDLGGEIRRYGTRQVHVTSEDGERVYRAGLGVPDEIEIGEDLDKIGVTIQDPEIDWARYLGRGGDVGNRVATLYLWWEGLQHEEMIGVLMGRTADVVYGEPGRPNRLAFTLSASRLDAPQEWPDSQATVDDSTFIYNTSTEIYDTTIAGQRYPVPFGYPGSGDDDAPSPFGVTPSLLAVFDAGTGASGSRVIISLGEVDAAKVHVWNSETTNPSTSFEKHGDCTVATGTDLLGRTYSYAWFPNPITDGSPIPVLGETCYVGWRNASGYGGGILNRERTGPLRGLGEVIRYCLEVSGVQADLDRAESERARLDAFKVDGMAAGADKGPVNLAQWVNDELGRLFPLRRVRSSQGVWYRYWQWTAGLGDAVAWLSADRGDVQRASAIRVSEGKANIFALEYQVRAMAGGYAGARRVLAPAFEAVYRPGLGQDDRTVGSGVCKRSYERYGRYIEAPPVTSDLIWSHSTALSILEHWAARDALPLERVTYEGPYLEHLEIGDVVALTDSGVWATERVGLVDSVTVGSRTTKLALVLLPRADVLTS